MHLTIKTKQIIKIKRRKFAKKHVHVFDKQLMQQRTQRKEVITTDKE